jgi:predicted ArsR family transcriptional regulator
MSFQAMAWAVKQPIPTYEKMVLLMLSNYSDSQNKCWPSVKTLAKDCGMSEKQIRRCMIKLESQLLIRREEQIRTYGQTTNMYYLDLDKLVMSLSVANDEGRPPPV